jgi:uncharacterized cupin superfamily protein
MACQGYDWAYALNGTLRLVLGEHDLILRPGEAAESDTRTPHWFGATSAGPVEYLSLIGKQGERAHVRAAPRHGPAELESSGTSREAAILGTARSPIATGPGVPP